MAQKVTGLTKYTFQRGSLPYQKEISVQYGETLLYIYYWTLWLTLHCALQCLIILYLPIQAITWWFLFFVPLHLHAQCQEKERKIRHTATKKFQAQIKA